MDITYKIGNVGHPELVPARQKSGSHPLWGCQGALPWPIGSVGGTIRPNLDKAMWLGPKAPSDVNGVTHFQVTHGFESDPPRYKLYNISRATPGTLPTSIYIYKLECPALPGLIIYPPWSTPGDGYDLHNA